jgi:hypothetical protein
MKFANAIEGGITGATTLTLLQEVLHKIDPKAPRAALLHKSGVIKKWQKSSKNGEKKDPKLYIELASELMANAAFFGLAGLGKKKNAVLRGGLLGAAAGLGAAFLKNDEEELRANGIKAVDGHAPGNAMAVTEDSTKKKILTVGLYTAGGLLAGVAMKKIRDLKKSNKKSKKGNKNWKK